MTEDKIKNINFEMPEELHADFKSQCAQKKIPMGKVLISLILDWLNLEDDTYGYR